MFNKFDTKNFNVMETIIPLNDYQEIIVDHDSKKIIMLSRGVGPALKIISNKSVVCKANKKSVSTCNTYMLALYLKNDLNAARELFSSYVYKLNNSDIEKTIVSYFANMTIEEFTNFINAVNHGIPAYMKYVCNDINRIIVSYLFCDDHTGKMHDMISCSTFVKYNPFCLARRKNCSGAICEYCFAYDQTSNYASQAIKLAKSHVFFTTVELSEDDIPDIDINKYPYFRFESFGDISNKLQFKNYCTIARKLKQLCTLWSKNPGIIQAAINDDVIIPNNLRIGLSSLYVNKPDIETAKRYSFVKFLFTVYTKEYAEKNNVIINCGARNCMTCARCYNKALNSYGNGNILLVNELVK